MVDVVQKANEYAYIVERTETGISAYVPDLPGVVATAQDLHALNQRIREVMCLHILGLLEDGDDVPLPTPLAALDLSDLEPTDVVQFAEPDQPDPISQALEHLIAKTRLRPSEVARRMHVPRSVISRLTSPVYHGHSVDSVRRFAESLGYEIELKFKKLS